MKPEDFFSLNDIELLKIAKERLQIEIEALRFQLKLEFPKIDKIDPQLPIVICGDPVDFIIEKTLKSYDIYSKPPKRKMCFFTDLYEYQVNKTLVSVVDVDKYLGGFPLALAAYELLTNYIWIPYSKPAIESLVSPYKATKVLRPGYYCDGSKGILFISPAQVNELKTR